MGIGPDGPPHPLDATRRRLAATFRLFTFQLHADEDVGRSGGADAAGAGTGGVGVAEDRWATIEAWSRPDAVAARIDQLAPRFDGHRDAAAGQVAVRFANSVILPLMAAYLLERRVPLAEPGPAAVRPDAELVLSGFAIGTGRFAALADDPAASHPDARIVTGEELGEAVADVIRRLADPLLVELRVQAPFGRRGLWGLMADAVGGGALAAARETGRDHRPMWQVATDVLDRLAGRQVPVHNRPRPLVVTCAGHAIPFNIRGTCCLRYKGGESEDDHHDPDFGAYCHSCPLVDDEALERHYADKAHQWLPDVTAR